MAEDDVSKLIIENPATNHGWVNESKEKPINPEKIVGKAVTINQPAKVQDVEAQLNELNEANDAFLVGAALGYSLGNGVFIKSTEELSSVADAYLAAEKGILDDTPVGRSLWLVRIDAMRDVDGYHDPRNENLPLKRSYYTRRSKFLDKAYRKWEPVTNGTQKPSREDFNKLTKKLVLVRKVVEGKQVSIPDNDLFDKEKPNVSGSYKDGFERAFNYTAEEQQVKPDFKDKFWYLLNR